MDVHYHDNDFSWKDLERECIARENASPKLCVYSADQEMIQHLQHDAAKNWNIFHHKNKGHAYKPRNYLLKEFPELQQLNDSQTNEKRYILDIGCGHGSCILPILNSLLNLTGIACDFSEAALQILRSSSIYHIVRDRCNTFHHDATSNTLQSYIIPESIDAVLMVFMLSAIPPVFFKYVIADIYKVLKPDGIVCFRDYGYYDLAMQRSKNRISQSLFYRNDGTLAYFFTRDELCSLFCGSGLFTEIESTYCTVLLRNRKRHTEMKRVWLHAKFKKNIRQ